MVGEEVRRSSSWSHQWKPPQFTSCPSTWQATTCPSTWQAYTCPSIWQAQSMSTSTLLSISKSEHAYSSLAISNLNIHPDSIHRRLQHRFKDLKISRGIFFLASAPHIISYALVEPDPRRPNCLDADMSLLFIRLSSSS